jgi:hypothetical protein
VAWLQLLSPITSFITYHFYTGASFTRFLQVAWIYADAWTRLRLILGGPIIALAIYATKRWALLVAVVCMVLSASMNLAIWASYPNPGPALFFFILISHGSLIAYLLLPAVRVAYLDRKLRWWENKPRYYVKVAAKVTNEKRKFAASILNISEGGVFLVTDRDLEMQDKLTIESEAFPTDLTLVGVVTHHSVQSGERGYGVRFSLGEKAHSKLLAYIGDLRQKGVPSTLIRRDWISEIKELAEDIFIHGKGWVPEISAPTPRQPEPTPPEKKRKTA